ncbi:DUF6285 domain-containing protein [Allopusillimonas ginsengisoli]|uniref:DUF6285 domain-containing protein n=1 Tax=Allopusillimonas ginsengisoli TaxID=453575 RepID=UPI001021430A|nr:DUF6285 domain-containing protein [Allopusillimonas ginsengisoli]TEA78610.1 acyl-CoA dehydrogenase [Allopusillimonas ginsengisoli]
MSNRPYGNELLDVARRSLLDKVLPAVSEDKVYDVLMVANAMAIAARELASGPQQNDEEDSVLAAQIRARDLPPQTQAQLHRLLLDRTRSALALSNPKYLNT